MRIQDYDSICNVTNPADIASAMSRRHRAARNAFWLSHGSELFPAISILVNGDLAYLHYFPKERHAGLASIGDLPGLKAEEFTKFFPEQSNEPFDVMNEAVVPFSDALKVAHEFSISATMPKCIRWNSLVDGE
jgi:hypothetical protein